MERCTVSLCPKCGRCYILGTIHICSVRVEGTTADQAGIWTNVPGGTTFTPTQEPTNQDYSNYYWPYQQWWWPTYYPYYAPHVVEKDFRPKCANDRCLYFKRCYSSDYGDCDNKSVYINEKGRCISFIDKYKTDAD